MSLVGKKLLILGANAETIPIVKKAQEMGVKVVVVDHIPNSSSKAVADEFYDINGKDVNKIVEIMKENGIDGVLLGVADPLMDSYVEICKVMSLPCFAQGETIGFFRNKNEFKHLCQESGLRVPKEYFSCKNIKEINKQEIMYPIVVKPAQSRGGKGCSYCKNELDLESSFKKAQISSENGVVLGEEYIDSEDVVATFVFREKKAKLLALYDRKMLKSTDRLGTVTYEQIFPSKYTDYFLVNKLACFQNMFESLGICKGVVNIQMFVHKGEFVLYDPDGIINGGICNQISDVVYNVDLLGDFIRFALGKDGFCDAAEINGRPKKHFATRIWILLKPGQIEKIEGRDLLESKDYLIDSLWRLSEGDCITEEMRFTEKATLARVTVIGSSQEEVEKRTEEVRSLVKVYDAFGNNMIDLRRI